MRRTARLNRASSAVILSSNGLLPRHGLGFPGRPFFGSTRVPTPRYRSCGTPQALESTTRPIHTSISAYRPRPKWSLRALAACRMGCWGDPNSGRVPPQGCVGGPREVPDRSRRPGRASKPGNARALVHFGPSACHRGERGSEKIGFPETATGVRPNRTFGNVPEAR